LFARSEGAIREYRSWLLREKNDTNGLCDLLRAGLLDRLERQPLVSSR
jgi:hypothetical protein